VGKIQAVGVNRHGFDGSHVLDNAKAVIGLAVTVLIGAFKAAEAGNAVVVLDSLDVSLVIDICQRLKRGNLKGGF
jgi:hypothetical protein